MHNTGAISIFIDGHCFDREYQGTHVYIRELYGMLSNLYPEIELFAGACNLETLNRALPFIPESNLLPYRYKGPGIMRYLTDIPYYLKKFRFDFAHFQYIAPFHHRSIATRSIVTLHDILFLDFPEQFPWRYRMARQRLFRNSFEHADISTTVSEYSKQRIAHHYKMDPNAISVIPSGVSHEFGASMNSQEARKYIAGKYGLRDFILYVSRIEPRKNQQALLSQYLDLELYREKLPLVFIGKSSITNREFSALLNSLSQEQKKWIHWLEQVPGHELESFYHAARLFVYPSKGEGFGLPPLEAALCGCPVLSSNATAMQDFPFPSDCSFDPMDENEFKRKLRSAIDIPPAEEKIKKIAGSIRLQFSWQANAEKFYRLIQQHVYEFKDRNTRYAGHS